MLREVFGHPGNPPELLARIQAPTLIMAGEDELTGARRGSQRSSAGAARHSGRPPGDDPRCRAHGPRRAAGTPAPQPSPSSSGESTRRNPSAGGVEAGVERAGCAGAARDRGGCERRLRDLRAPVGRCRVLPARVCRRPDGSRRSDRILHSPGTAARRALSRRGALDAAALPAVTAFGPLVAGPPQMTITAPVAAVGLDL